MDSANFQEFIICGICLETYNENSKCPRMLSCGHSFCHSCFEKLLTLSPCCPTCKTKILFNTAYLIPINYTIKHLLNIGVQIWMPQTSVNLDSESDKSDSLASKGQPINNPRKYLSEGFCSEHDNYKEMRCMDCELWICGMCSTLHHKNCRTLVVSEAYKELKKQVSQKVEIELGERKTVIKGFAESLRVLDEERKSLIEEIKRKELELKDREKRIEELESLKSEEEKFCDKLKKLQEIAESSANDTEFFKSINELDKLLEEGKKQIPKILQNLHLPETREALASLCWNEPVYAVEDRYDGTRYGKVAVKDGEIWIHHFQLEKPDAKLFTLKDLLAQFSESTELPKTVFLQLTNVNNVGVTFDVVIATEGLSPRAKNFVLLCSGLERLSYKGFTMRYMVNVYDDHVNYQIYPGPPPVVEGISNDVSKTPLEEAGVYGMWEDNSWFQVQLRDLPSYSLPKFGVVLAGLQDLKNRRGRNCSITDSGLVI